MISPTQKLVTQSVARAAAKTFLQAFFAVLALLAVPVLTSWATTLQQGGELVVDVDWFVRVLIAATGGGIAALISFAGNTLRS